MKILIADKFGDDLPAKLAPYGEVVTEDLAHLPQAEVVLVRSRTKANREYIDRAPKLKLIIRGGVGLDNIDSGYCKQKGIIVRNTPEASSIAVAELVFAHLLAIQRQIVEAHNATREGRWLKKELKGGELYGKTLGLIGIGRIGQEVSRRAAAFGMKVIAYDPFVAAAEGVELKSLAEVLGQSDFLTLHVPLTDETREIINQRTLALVKPGVVIVNTARGKNINEKDLATALAAGRVRYAGLDVFASEPPEGSPLTGLPNVLLTPHIGASTRENLQRIGVQVEKLIGQFARGELKA